jgi:hypothetical protein
MQRAYQRNTEQWVREGHRVAADAAEGLFRWAAVADPQTIAVFDTSYRRITLVRLARGPAQH